MNMKNCTVSLLILFVALLFFNHAQTYYPLPEESAHWTVIEYDWNSGDSLNLRTLQLKRL